MRERWLLALDTSSEQAGIALTDGSRVAEVSWHAGRDQTTSVLREVDHLCELVSVTIADLDAVAVATGPGMFNGLRVGMSVAKGLVLGLDVPLIGVPTLDVAAYPFLRVATTVVATVAAGRGRLVWASYRADGDRLHLLTPPRNGTANELAAAAAAHGPGVVVTGELTLEQEQTVSATAATAVPPPAARRRRPASLAALAWERFAVGDVDDAVTLEPVYLHGVAAGTTPNAPLRR